MRYVKEFQQDQNKYKFVFSNKTFNEYHCFEWIKTGSRDDKAALKKAIDEQPNKIVKKFGWYVVKVVYPKDAFKVVRTPKIKGVAESDYIMPAEAKLVASAIRRKKNVLIVGPAGCGKSRMIMDLAKAEGMTLERINLNGGTTDTSLVGEKGLMTDEKGNTITGFSYGVLPRAMKEGAWLLLDEMDFAQPEYLAVLQAVFEGNGTPLTLLDNGGEKVYPHPNFRIIATSNTLGRGDTEGYHGTNMLNIATLDRWSVITLDYTKHEPKILMRILNNAATVDKMMMVAKRVREAIKQGKLPDLVFSTRRLIHWAEAIVDGSLSIEDATELEVTGRLTKDEKSIISEFIKDSFGIRIN